MQIRNIDKSFLPRFRADDKDPVRKTAKELGVFLDKLSEAVKQSHRRFADTDDDSVDDTLKKSKRYTRGFKLQPAAGTESAPAESDLTDEQNEALDLLKEARSLAADASLRYQPFELREQAQERFQAIFREIGERRISTLMSLSPVLQESDAGATLFSLSTAESARSAYLGVEDLIVKLFEIGTQDESEYAANPEHETALSASDRLRDFLLNEGPSNAFGRFREINRSNVLALLK